MAHPGIDIILEVLGADRATETDLVVRRNNLAALAGSPPPPDGITAERIELADRLAERLTPAGASDDTVILYLHGGGYCSGSVDTHRGIGGNVALAAGATVVALDYRLAPEDPFPAALNDALLAFDQLAPRAIAIVGDSAGGGLAVATALALRDRGGAQPVALALFSPWTDLTQSSPSMTSRADQDPMISPAVLSMMADAYLAGTDPRTTLASPLFADLGGLPPTRIDVGDREILLDDSTALAEGIRAAGGEAHLRIWPEMIHVFQAFPPELVPESTEAIAAAGAFLARHLAA